LRRKGRMVTYTVKYKRLGFFSRWRKLKKVKGDGLVEEDIIIGEKIVNKTILNIRLFILENETRIEIPTDKTIFKFSKERFYSIQERMEEEARQPLQINKR
jgi:hypothetical protein